MGPLSSKQESAAFYADFVKEVKICGHGNRWKLGRHHWRNMLGSFALMPKNRLHFILFLTFNHHEGGRSLLPFEVLELVEPLDVLYMRDRMDPLGWGQIQFIRHWRNHLGDLVGSNPEPP